MLSKLSILLLLFGISSCFAGLRGHLGFKGNVSGSDIKLKKWQYRQTTFKAWDGPRDIGGAFVSGSVSKNKTKIKGQGNQVTVDVIYGACAFPVSSSNPYPPRTFIASFSGTGKWSALKDFTQGDVSQSRGFIGTTYYGLVEYDPSGNAVANYTFTDNKMDWAATDMGGSDDDTLKWITFSGTPNNNALWTTSFTFVVSSVAGIINLGSATVTPTSIESIINITGWPYQSPLNSLALHILVATGDATVSNGTLVSGSSSNASEVDFGLSNVVYADGNVLPVTFSPWTRGSLSGIADTSFVAQLTARYGKDYSVNLVHVTFPAGANNIMYDPTIGATTDVADDDDDDSSASSAMRNVVCVSLLLLVIAFIL